MNGRRTLAALVVAIIVGIAAWLLWPGPASPPLGSARRGSGGTSLVPKVGGAVAGSEPQLEGESRLADQLNAPGGDIRADLKILNELFETWQSNFPRGGNPVGENAEITAALSGANPLRFAFLPRGHRAVNARGELCDRWGTPFRFHQVSGQQMEIRSAGPDRKFLTDDDAVWTSGQVESVVR